jgi:hypothetical protein
MIYIQYQKNYQITTKLSADNTMSIIYNNNNDGKIFDGHYQHH